MMTLKALVVFVGFVYTYGQFPENAQYMPPFATQRFTGDVKEVLKIPPPPMRGFDLVPWLGRWYFQFLKAPCSWTVSEDFTDFSQFNELQGQTILQHETMRNLGVCNSVTAVLSLSGPGVFNAKDLTGDNWSGKNIVVATDYKSYCCSWGCTKWSSFDNTCEYPYLYIKTREAQPGPEVLRRIDMALQNIWGISSRQLTRIVHRRSCTSGGNPMG